MEVFEVHGTLFDTLGLFVVCLRNELVISSIIDKIHLVKTRSNGRSFSLMDGAGFEKVFFVESARESNIQSRSQHLLWADAGKTLPLMEAAFHIPPRRRIACKSLHQG